MLTGGFRSKVAMEAALTDGDLDVIGLGRPLCGSPSCVNDLLRASVEQDFSLPQYEDILQPGSDNCLGKAFRGCLGCFKLGRTAFAVSVQAWYYESIYRIADGAVMSVGDVQNIGCISAWFKNEKEEQRIATGLIGPQCVGTHCECATSPC